MTSGGAYFILPGLATQPLLGRKYHAILFRQFLPLTWLHAFHFLKSIQIFTGSGMLLIFDH